MRRATVIVDASFCDRTKAAGWAAWVAMDDHPRVRRSGLFRSQPLTSTDAEFKAILIGAWYAASMGAEDVLVQSDCLGALHKFSTPRDGPCSDLKLLRARVPQGVRFRTKHVKGHTDVKDSRSYVNRWCDHHAKKHMRKQRKKFNGK